MPNTPTVIPTEEVVQYIDEEGYTRTLITITRYEEDITKMNSGCLGLGVGTSHAHWRLRAKIDGDEIPSDRFCSHEDVIKAAEEIAPVLLSYLQQKNDLRTAYRKVCDLVETPMLDWKFENA